MNCSGREVPGGAEDNAPRYGSDKRIADDTPVRHEAVRSMKSDRLTVLKMVMTV